MKEQVSVPILIRKPFDMKVQNVNWSDQPLPDLLGRAAVAQWRSLIRDGWQVCKVILICTIHHARHQKNDTAVLERDGGDSVTTLGRMMAGLLYKDIYLWMWLDDMSMTWLVWCVLWLNLWVTFWKFPNLPFASYNEYTGTFVLVPWQHCKFNLKCMYIA